MTIDQALYAHVTATAAVTAIISTRFYPVAAPQSPTYPLGIYHRVSQTRVASLQGASGLCDPRFQISALASTQSGARALAEALRKAVSGYQGLMGDLSVTASVAESDTDLYYDDISIYQSSFDVFLTHQESLS